MKPLDTSTPNARISLTFLGDTADLLRRAPEVDRTIIYPLIRRASIKDILESLGVPHTEVGRIVLDGREQTFEKIAGDGEHFEIHPLSPALPPTVATILRPVPLSACIFLVDINVGRLAGLLRMAGFDAEAVGSDTADTANAANAANATIILRAIREGRILLTRNRDLLKHRKLVFGRLVLSQNPEQQLKEIINLYRLQDQLQPFSRCIACNAMLAEVEKSAIIDRLLPLTKKYFHHFKQCTGCGKIYWHGSHHEKMTSKLGMILGTPPREDGKAKGD
jgi:hypothetical protein